MADSAVSKTTCMELALEGERLCKTGNLKDGVRYFEEAIQTGTDDDRTLSAIYSQLGNAYFYMEDYQKALHYHQMDVELVHQIGDEAAEAKACGNLGNTYKMLGKFDEAAVYCRRYLEISKKLKDQVGEGRALYNLGNIYHTQGKIMIGASAQEPGELSADIKSSLQKAVEYYEMNLQVVTQLNDYTFMGRAYGNLGNTHYLLGNFEQAVASHKKRLELARQVNDKSAERRAHLNLGNANVFLGNFTEAIENYSATLRLSQELHDKNTEAHSCYSLANTYTFLRDYNSAVNYHLKYLELIKEFDDKLGEGRAYWSLVNIYQMVSDPETALTYAKRHREIAEQLGDRAGLASAELNIEELEMTISHKQAAQQSSANSAHQSDQSKRPIGKRDTVNMLRLTPDKRQEQEQRRFKKQLSNNLVADIDGLAARRRSRSEKGLTRSTSSERLLELIADLQGGRIDDQRCEILNRPTLFTDPKSRIADGKENFKSDELNPTVSSIKRGSQPSIANPLSAMREAATTAIKKTYRKASLAAYPTAGLSSIQSQRRPTVSAEHREQLFDMIAGAQGQRMDEQRASLPVSTLANGVLRNPRNPGLLARAYTVDHGAQAGDRVTLARPGEALPETIPENQLSSRPSQSRTSQPALVPPDSASTQGGSRQHKLTRHFQTVDPDGHIHDEKFLDSLMKYQSTRFNDQRSELPNKGLTDKAKGQPDNFIDLIQRFQSDRIEDQRSAPPTSK